MTLLSANDAFTNPNSPWYYVVGSLFLLLIVAALVIYNVVAKRKRANSEHDGLTDTITDTVPPEAADAAVSQEPEEKSEEEKKPENVENAENEERPETVSAPAPEEKAEEPKEDEAQQQTVAPEPTETNAQDEGTQNGEEEHTTEEKSAPTEEKAELEQQQAENAESAEKIVEQKPEKAESAAKPAKKPTAKKAQKPFIDRLIADKTVHGVYNELKNTVLSYPGMKAKLGKDGETFAFGADSKAEISLDGSTIVLKLAVDFDAVPAQFGAEKADGEMPTKLAVPETSIDSAQKLIMFAMNISMLTRNDRHRHVDYVQNAINAKNRAKSKQASATKSKK